MGDVAGQECDDHAGRPGDQTHEHDRRALADAQECRRPRDTDPPAKQDDPGRPGCRGEPGHRGDRTHDRGRLVGVAEGLGQADREEALEGDHREAPEQLDRDECREDARPAQQSDAVADDARDLSDGRHHRTDSARRPDFMHERNDGDEIDDAEAERHEQGQGQCRDRRDGRQRDERTRDERSDRDGEAQHRAAGTQAILDLRGRVGGQRGIHVPGLQGPAVERPEDPLEHGRGGEQHDRIRDVQETQRDEPDQAREDEHRPATERVGQPAGRQFEDEHDEALEAEDQADLRQRQPAGQRQQDRDRDEQTGREPAQADQDEVAGPCRPSVEGGHRGPRSSGKAYT